MAAVGTNPLPPIQTSELQVGVETLVTLPPTGSVALARVQQIVDAPDAANRLYALDDRGVIRVVENGEVLRDPFLDLRGGEAGFVYPSPEAGLRSVAFHPDFANPGTAGYGKVYTTHSASVESAQPGVPLFDVVLGGMATSVRFHDVLTEWTVPDPERPFAVDPASRREVLRIEEALNNHNLGPLLFDPNARPGDPTYGILYAGVADGGGPGDPNDLSQRPDQIQGKIIRIDPLRQADGTTYGVPEDNPFLVKWTPSAGPLAHRS